MKRFYLLGYATMCLALSFGVSACGDDDNGVELPSDDHSQKILSDSEQKQKLEEVACDFLAEINAADFQTLVDVVDYASERYLDNWRYSTDALDDWWDAALEACELKSNSDVAQTLVVASNFTGRFEAGSNAWEYKGESKNLEFTFDDKTGRTCVLTVTASDKYTAVHHREFDSYELKWNSVTRRYEEERYSENTIGVPEKVTVTLTRAGSKLVEATMTTSITTDGKGEVSLSKGVAAATVKASVCGYDVEVERAKFDTAVGAEASVKLKKGGKTLLTASATANGELSEVSHQDRYNEWTEVELTQGGGCTVNINVMDKVSVRGTIKNLKSLTDNLDKANDEDDNETKFKRYIDNANSQLDLGVYYDGGRTRMANLILLPEAHRSYYGSTTYWETVPAVKFEDDTTYTLEEFFDEKTFRKVIDAYEDLLDDFEHLAD